MTYYPTRSLDEFLELLRAHEIGRVADIRTVLRPRHPHFAGDALRISLPAIGIEHATSQGSAACANRGAIPEQRMAARRVPRIRGLHGDRRISRGAYRSDRMGGSRADLSGPPEQHAGPERPGLHTVMMCAEAVWWRCHRQLAADALLARGVEVAHITGIGAATAHKLTDFARVVDGEVRIQACLTEGLFPLARVECRRATVGKPNLESRLILSLFRPAAGAPSASASLAATRTMDRSGLDSPPRVIQAIQCGPRASV